MQQNTAKSLLLILFLLILESCATEDMQILRDLLPLSNTPSSSGGVTNKTSGAVIRKLFQVHPNDSISVTSMALHGLLYLAERRIITEHLHLFLDGKTMKKLLEIGYNGEEPSEELIGRNEVIHGFFVRLVDFIGSAMATRIESGIFASMNGCAVNIVRNLRAESIEEHYQVPPLLVNKVIPSSLMSSPMIYCSFNRRSWRRFLHCCGSVWRHCLYLRGIRQMGLPSERL